MPAVRMRQLLASVAKLHRYTGLCHNHFKTMPETTEKAQNLFEIKGVLTKFMRMLFPLEFRIDSLANSGPMLPFHYPAR
jgi:hypothetical protein